MSKVVRYEFFGDWLVFWLWSVTVIGIPIAILYVISRTLRVDTELENPEEFVNAWRSNRLKS
jgi:hypothetical protein